MMPRLTPSLALGTLLATTSAPTSALAQWQPDGVAVSGASGGINLVIADGEGGGYFGWRNGANAGDVWIQRLDAFGLPPFGWQAGGIPLALLPESQDLVEITRDGTGGLLVLWEHNINDAPTSADLFVQRVLGDGSIAPGWPAPGLRILAPGQQTLSGIASDGAGGAYIVWQDDRAWATRRYDVYALHLLADGSIAPGWPADGLPIAALPGHNAGPLIVSDGVGGAFILWADDRNNPGGVGDTYGVRINGDGTLAPGWVANGNRLTVLQPRRGLVPDESGGIYLWTTNAGATPGFDNEYFLYRFTAAGAPSPGWPANGVLLCSVPGDRAATSMEPDGQGGVLLAWYDYRPPYDQSCGEIFALRVLPSGARAPGWSANGSLVSDPTNSTCEYTPGITRDEMGGAYIVWTMNGPSQVQHLTASGLPAPGWPPFGVRLASSGAQNDPQIAADGEGGAIVAWSEACCGRLRVWAQKYVPTGIVAASLSLVSSVAERGRVSLEWFAANGAGLAATVERREGDEAWRPLANLTADGTGHLRYEDRDVTPGARYRYRLAYRDGGAAMHSAETLVETPAALELALEGFRPNPAVGPPLVSFTLARSAHGTLELYDLAGRRMAWRDLDGLPAGRHVVRFESHPSLAPGAYVIRLTHAGRVTAARGVVVR